MPRQIKELKHVYPKDQRCFKILSKSGAMSTETFNKLEISKNRIKSYQDAGLIKKTFVPDRCSTNGKNYYILTRTGKDFCKNECGVKNFISNGNSTFHNSKVSEYIASNLTKQEMETCLSERELSDFLQSRLDEFYSTDYTAYYDLKNAIDNQTLSFPDMLYFKQDGTVQAIEIITNNYKQEHIESKTQTAELLNIKINIIHTREV